jgi:hypothetical protein
MTRGRFILTSGANWRASVRAKNGVSSGAVMKSLPSLTSRPNLAAPPL